MNVKAIERVVLIVAAYTIGVKLDDRSVEAALDIAKALDLPLAIMATDHYVADLRARVKQENAEKHQQVIRIGNDNEEEIIEQIGDADLVILPSMGSQKRFKADSERLPYQLHKQLDSSLAVIHFP